MEQFVCAFRGRRDSYQAPLALAEASLLDQFYTDAYAFGWLKAIANLTPASVRHKIHSRFEPGIPSNQVHCLWRTTILEHFRHRAGCDPTLTFNKLDQHFSHVAASRAAKAKSHLFLYSPYAWEAFTARYPHQPRKILFQYHPHSTLEGRILSNDDGAYPQFCGSSFSAAARSLPELLFRRERDSWKHADLILCASAFTLRSLLEAGAEPKRCRVIPYGIETPAPVTKEAGGQRNGSGSAERFHAVFVGTGCQRKGLHHLLLAWQKAVLPKDSKLTLVCRTLDREFEPIVASTPRVQLRRGISPAELNCLYASSSLFVMPSLVEGFGQVYLEALAQGCPVLGTPNTCLPDLGGEAGGVFIVQPGNIEELIAKLERLANLLPANEEFRAAAQACAARFTWPAFRQGLRTTLATAQT